MATQKTFKVRHDCDHNNKKLSAGDRIASAKPLDKLFPDRFEDLGMAPSPTLHQDQQIKTQVVEGTEEEGEGEEEGADDDDADDDGDEEVDASNASTWQTLAERAGLRVQHVDGAIRQGGGFFLYEGSRKINKRGFTEDKLPKAIEAYSKG